MERPFAYFVQVEPIDNSSQLFQQLNDNNFHFSYFQKDQLYYLFLYGKKSALSDLDFIHRSAVVIQELDVKKRRIRSLRGFFIYALEMLEDEKTTTVLQTNVRPLFWKQVKNVIKQNQKNALSNFLFGYSSESMNLSSDSSTEQQYVQLEKQVQRLQNELALLRDYIEKII